MRATRDGQTRRRRETRRGTSGPGATGILCCHSGLGCCGVNEDGGAIATTTPNQPLRGRNSHRRHKSWRDNRSDPSDPNVLCSSPSALSNISFTYHGNSILTAPLQLGHGRSLLGRVRTCLAAFLDDRVLRQPWIFSATEQRLGNIWVGTSLVECACAVELSCCQGVRVKARLARGETGSPRFSTPLLRFPAALAFSEALDQPIFNIRRVLSMNVER